MSLYPLIRPLKAGGASALSVSRAAFGRMQAGLKALPDGAKVTMSKLGRYAAYPAGIGAGVGVGSMAAGEGIRRGFGFDLSDPKKAAGTLTGVAIFAVVVAILVFVYFKVMK